MLVRVPMWLVGALVERLTVWPEAKITIFGSQSFDSRFEPQVGAHSSVSAQWRGHIVDFIRCMEVALCIGWTQQPSSILCNRFCSPCHYFGTTLEPDLPLSADSVLR